MLERRSLSAEKHSTALIHSNHGYNLSTPVNPSEYFTCNFSYTAHTDNADRDCYHAHFTDEKTEHEEELNKLHDVP